MYDVKVGIDTALYMVIKLLLRYRKGMKLYRFKRLPLSYQHEMLPTLIATTICLKRCHVYDVRLYASCKFALNPVNLEHCKNVILIIPYHRIIFIMY